MESSKPCIYCKSTKNTFNSVEHVVPESLGNTDIILDKGMVCDICNNESLSNLDEVLVNFEPFKFFRPIYGIRNKQGKLPIGRFGNMHISSDGKGHIKVDIHKMSKRHFEQLPPSPDGSVKFTLKTKGKKYTKDYAKKLARAFYKIGLGLVCIDHGREFVLSSRFDELRDIIAGKQDFKGHLVIRATKPSTEPRLQYRFINTRDTGQFTLCNFNIFGTEVIFGMENRTICEPKKLKEAGVSVLEW